MNVALGALLWTWQWAFRFHRRQGISWPAEYLISFSRRTLLHGVSQSVMTVGLSC